MSRTHALFLVLCLVAAVAGVYAISYEPSRSLARVEAEAAPALHALIFRYDIEFSSTEQIERLIAQDGQLGLRASAFALTLDFRRSRNVLFDYSRSAGEVQIHARPMPDGLTDTHASGGDPTPYQFGHVDPDLVLDAYHSNLMPELAIFEYNGFYPKGLSLHSSSNRLPWDDDTNYRLIAASAARAGLDWVSVTSQAFSMGSDPEKTDPARFNAYDAEVTSRQPSRWVTIPTGLRSTRRILAVPTSWRDRYLAGSSDPEELRLAFARMREDIDRHWLAARQQGSALVLLFHPMKYVGRPVVDELFLEFKRALLETAREQSVPVMTFSEYASRLTAAR